MTDNDARLLCLLNLARLDEADREQARRLAARVTDWAAFWALAARSSALLLTARRARELGIGLAALERHAHSERALLDAGRDRVAWARRFLDEAARLKLEVIVLKGGLFGSSLYGDPAYKKMNDIDVLVRRGDAPAFAEILRGLEFSSVGLLLGSSEFDEDSHHCPPFVSPDLRCLVGIHWGLASKHARWKPDLEGVWARRVPAEVCGAPAFRMSWEDNLLHLCIHLPFFKVGVRELADVYNLALFCEPRLDWALFASLVERWRAADAAWRVLSLARALIPFDIPDGLLARWRAQATPFTIADTEDRARLGARLIATRSVQIGKVEKAFSVFRLTRSHPERVGAWAMTWKLTFWPAERELAGLVPRYALAEHPPLARLRLLAGVNAWRAMARDYGNLPLALITLVNAGVVVRETLLWPFRAGGPPIRSGPAARILEALE